MMNNLLRRFGLRREATSDNQTKPSSDDDFFLFRQFGTCGFPNKPSCLSLDEELGLLAIGTKTGFIHVFGQPGVHLQGEHETKSAVIHVSFFKGKSKFITVCEDSSFVVWKVKASQNEQDSNPCPENDKASDDSDVCPDSDSLLVRGERKKLHTSPDFDISCCCLDERHASGGKAGEAGQEVGGDEKESDCRLYVGTTDGNVFAPKVGERVADVDERNVGDVVLSHDEVVVEHFSEEDVKHLGSVVSIVLHPAAPHKILVGYSLGFAAMWNLVSMRSECVFSAYQQLENLAFNHDGSEFVSSHSDGSYIIWNTIDSTEPREPASTPYGPYQCEAIDKFVWRTIESSSMMIFSGGMPRSGYGDRWTVTIMRGDGDEGEQSHVVLDLTSRVIDFVVVDSVDVVHEDEEAPQDGNAQTLDIDGTLDDRQNDQKPASRQVSSPHSLVVLAEEEMVVIDLVGRDWPSYRLPHLTSPHCSAITSIFHVSEAPENFLKKLGDAGRLQQMKNVTFTRKSWPFLGGQSMFSKDSERDLLLTGHEDGSVRFWQTKHGDIELLYRLDTAQLFGIELSNSSEINNDSDEDWPPFKKVGAYNPFTDDPRLAIRQMILSVSQEPETLLLAGTAGQIIVCEFNSEPDRRIHRKGSCKEQREVLVEENTEVERSAGEVVSVHGPMSEASLPSSQSPQGLEGDEVDGGTGGYSDHQKSLPTLPGGIGQVRQSPGHVPGTSGEGSKCRARVDLNDPMTSVQGHRTTSTTFPVDVSCSSPSAIRPQLSEIEAETLRSGSSSRAQRSARNRESYSSSLSSTSFQFEIKVSSVNLVGDRDDFVWMGHTPLEVVNLNDKGRARGGMAGRSGSPPSVFTPYPLTSSLGCSAPGESGPGFQASCVVLVHPPVSCTSLALQANWQLVGFGSEYGYGLYDYNVGRIVFSKGSKSDGRNGSGGGASSMFGLNSRFSDIFRRTVRASFRRLERARSEFRERRRRSQQAIWKSFSMSRGAAGHPIAEPSSSLQNSSVATESAQRPPTERAPSVPEKPSSSALNDSEPHKRNGARPNAGTNDIFRGNSLERDPQTASLSRAGTPIVRCLYFAEDVFALPAAQSSAKGGLAGYPEFGTFWVGTSLGTIFMYNIVVSCPSKRALRPVVHSLAKEIRLKHEAPVLDICILNRSGSPLCPGRPHYPMPVVNRNRRWKFPSSIFGSLMSSSSSSGQCLVVCSQKQVKVFSYPGLKAKRKVKVDRAGSIGGSLQMPSGEGRQSGAASPPSSPSNGRPWAGHRFLPTKNITKVAYSCFENKSDESVVESGLVCLTDDGAASVYNMPSLKLRFSTSAVSKESMNDMKLCVLTSRGYGFYLCSPSEFGKFSVSAICPKIRSLSLLPVHLTHCETQKKKDSDGSKKHSSCDENPKRTPNSGSIVTAADSILVVAPLAEQSGIPVTSESPRSFRSPESGSRSLVEQNVREELGPAAKPDVDGDPDLAPSSDGSLERSGVQLRKVTDISYIKDEQMIEKIINKFVQVEVPDGGFAACRKEIQFSIPLQQKSRGRSLPGHGTRGDPRLEETTEEELSKPGTNESETSVSSEGVGLGGGI